MIRPLPARSCSRCRPASASDAEAPGRGGPAVPVRRARPCVSRPGGRPRVRSGSAAGRRVCLPCPVPPALRRGRGMRVPIRTRGGARRSAAPVDTGPGRAGAICAGPTRRARGTWTEGTIRRVARMSGGLRKGRPADMSRGVPRSGGDRLVARTATPPAGRMRRRRAAEPRGRGGRMSTRRRRTVAGFADNPSPPLTDSSLLRCCPPDGGEGAVRTCFGRSSPTLARSCTPKALTEACRAEQKNRPRHQRNFHPFHAIPPDGGEGAAPTCFARSSPTLGGRCATNTLTERYPAHGNSAPSVNGVFTPAVLHPRTVEKEPRRLVSPGRFPPWGGRVPRKR